MKLSFPARSLSALAVLVGLASPALADVPNSAHSMMQLGQRHVNYAGTPTGPEQTLQDVSEPSPAPSDFPNPEHSMVQSGQRHMDYADAQNGSAGAKINLEVAQSIALKAQPGSVTSRELEQEAGGSGLRYSFDIKSGADTHEVGVDAVTGAVLENSVEGPNAD